MCSALSVRDRDQFVKEAELMVSLRPSQYVVQILGISFDESHDRLAIVLEFMSGGSLEDYLENLEQDLETPRVLHLIRGIARG